MKLGTEVLSLACTFDGVPALGRWSISVDSKDSGDKDLASNQTFDAVIMTVRTANLLLSFRVLVSGQWSGKLVAIDPVEFQFGNFVLGQAFINVNHSCEQ